MDNVKITDEMLALFLEGRTTPEETVAIYLAAKKDPRVAFMLHMAEAQGLLAISPLENSDSVEPSKKLYSLGTVRKATIKQNKDSMTCIFKSIRKNAPILALAASSETNDCVVRCEEYVLEKFGLMSHVKDYSNEARLHGWLKETGTSLYNIGRLLEMAGLSVSRFTDGSYVNMKTELDAGCSIIVAVNKESLSGNVIDNDTMPNHAMIVSKIDEAKDLIVLYDPSENKTWEMSIDDFYDIWQCSNKFFVSVVERGKRPYVPHPEDVSGVELPKPILSLSDILAENAHEVWARDRQAEGWKYGENKDDNLMVTPFMRPYDMLKDDEKATDYTTALHSLKLLYKLGFELKRETDNGYQFESNHIDGDGNYIARPVDLTDVELPEEVLALTEYIAENAHEEWSRQRFAEGWVYGAKSDKDNLVSPDLIPYCELLDKEKQYDRKMAMDTLRLLYKMGYVIEKRAI